MIRALLKNLYNYEFFPMIISENLLGGLKFIEENKGLKIYYYVK